MVFVGFYTKPKHNLSHRRRKSFLLWFSSFLFSFERLIQDLVKRLFGGHRVGYILKLDLIGIAELPSYIAPHSCHITRSGNWFSTLDQLEFCIWFSRTTHTWTGRRVRGIKLRKRVFCVAVWRSHLTLTWKMDKLSVENFELCNGHSRAAAPAWKTTRKLQLPTKCVRIRYGFYVNKCSWRRVGYCIVLAMHAAYLLHVSGVPHISWSLQSFSLHHVFFFFI